MVSKFSVKKPMTVAVAVILVILLGVISFMHMTTDLLPSLDLPYVAVITTYPGASPEKIEQTVTKPLEKTIATTSGVEKLTSVSSENSSMIIVQFTQGTNMDSAMIDLNGKIDLVKGAFDDAVSAPTLMRINPDMMPVMVASVDADGRSLTETTDLVNETVLPALERVAGVASVSASGLVEDRLEVTLSQEKIDALNDRLLAAVDSKLAETQQQLDDAEAKLNDAETTLNSQSQSQTQQLAQGSQALAAGQQQLQSALTNLPATEQDLKDQLTELKNQRDLLKAAVDGLAQIDAACPDIPGALAGLAGGIDQVQSAIDGLDAQIEVLEALPNLDEVQQAQLAALRQARDEAQAQLDPLKTQQAQLQQLQQQRDALMENLKQMNMETPEAQQAALLQLDTGITQLEQGLAALPETKEQLQQQLNELNEKATQLESGKVMLSTELAKASAQLSQSKVQLEQGKTQFEAARETAYQNAGLDGVITAEMLSGVLQAENFAMPAGSITEDGQSYIVKVGDAFAQTEELSGLVLMDTKVEGVGEVTLADVADIAVSDNAGEYYAKINGNDGVLLTLQKQSTASTTEVCHNIQDTMEALMAENPGLHLISLQDQGRYIDIIIRTVLENLLMGGALAIVILFIFLRDIKPTMIIAFSIPISLMFAVTLMYFTGVTMNIISLSGLALGVGMLVDNSIVVIENTYRLRAQGMSAAQAAVKGASQVAGAIVASTLTTICVFLPIVFTEGISRQLFTDMGLTIGYSLVASLIVALTLVPAMSSGLLRHDVQKRHRIFDAITHFYAKVLRLALKHKLLPIALVLVLLVVSVFGALGNGTAFMPETDSQQVMVTLEMPEGSKQADTRAMADTVLERLIDIPGIQTVGALESSDTNMSLYVLLSEQRDQTSQQIGRAIEAATADLDCAVTASGSSMDISALGGSGIQVVLQGENLDTLTELAQDVQRMLQDVPGTKDVSDVLEGGNPELMVSVDKNRAMGYGLTVAQVYQQIAQKLKGETNATTLNLSEGDLPVVIVDPASQGITSANLGELEITTAAGNSAAQGQASAQVAIPGEDDEENGEDEEEAPKSVPLSDIAAISQRDSLSSINHTDQQRTLSVSTSVDADHNIGLVSDEIQKRLDAMEMPAGYSAAISGESETINSTMNDLILMIALAVVFIYLIMVAQFQSLRSPFIVMFTIPLAFTGGFLALWLCGFEVSIIAMLGLLVLAGIVVNNGIVFVDYANQLRAEGMERREALVEAGRARLRPILMTALTTILGLSTMAMGVGMGADMIQPMAVVTIGGLTYATLLTLFIVPILYDLMNKKAPKRVEIEEG
ncbi:MAG: efflux RND transporter permease subunit [Christensenellales bacterium]|jgi:multidrug efflux pump subunit AcrB